MKRSMVAAVIGYWVGKFYKRREILLAFVFALPFGVKFAYDEGTLASTLKRYSAFTIQSNFNPLNGKSAYDTVNTKKKTRKWDAHHRTVR
jgi:hypothetical protein